MPADLRRGDDVALRLNGPRPEQRLPVRLARAQREGARVREDLRRAARPGAAAAGLGQGDGRLGEAQVEADEAAYPADGGVEGGDEAGAGLDGGALAEDAVVEDVQLVVRGLVPDGAVGVNVQRAVEDLAGFTISRS